MLDDICVTINDIKENLKPGEKFKAVGVLTSARLKRDKNDQPYWDLAVMDASGTLNVKAWSDTKWWDARLEKRRPWIKTSWPRLSAYQDNPSGYWA